jgi:hypothetical protein
MRLWLDACRPPQFKPNAQDERRARQGRQGAIEKSAAITQTIACRIECVQRNDENIGVQHFSVSWRGNAGCVGGQRCFWRPCAKNQRRLRRDDHRQGNVRARCAPDFDDRAYVRLVLDRPAERNAFAGRLRKNPQQMRGNLSRPRRHLCWRAGAAGGEARCPQRLAAVWRRFSCLPIWRVFHAMLLCSCEFCIF